MKAQRGLIIVMTAILLSLLIPCITSSAGSSSSGRVPSSTPRFKALDSSLNAVVDKTVYLTVRVKDEGGKPVSGAHVNVYQGTLSSLIIVPPAYQDDTNVYGIATFRIIVKTGEKLALSIEVAREDMQTDKRDVDKGTEFPTRFLEDFKLKPKGAAEGIDVISVGLNVLDDGFNLVEGAKVLIRAFGERYQGTTDRDGKVVIPVQFTLKKTYTIEVSKSGYKPNKKFIELDKPQVGTTVFAGNIEIEKGAVGVEVTVSVKDQENSNKAVAEAVVVLDSSSSAGYYSSTTDESGTATFLVLETGSFAVRISQDYYEPLPKTEVRLLAGETSRSFNFTLKAKPKSDGGRDTIEVTVLANDPGDEKSKPKPLAGAMVKIGGGGAATDSSGRVTLSGTFAGRQEVTAEANGYKSQTKAVGVSRLVAFSVGTGSTTFILDPELSESSPVRLIVEVRNAAAPNNPLEGASVLLRLQGRIVGQENTTNQGEARFELKDSPDASLAKLRSGIRLDVAKDKYKIKLSDVTIDLLQPSLEPRRVTVFLERDWDDLRKAIDDLNQRVLAWNNDIAAAVEARDLAQKLAAQAQQAQAKVAGILREIEYAGKAAEGANGISALSLQCREAATLKSNILGYKSDAAAKEQALKTSLNNASALAANCSQFKDAEAVNKMYREAIQMVGAIGALEKKAVKDGNELKKLANENNDLKKIIAEVEKKVAEIRQEMNKAEQAAKTVGIAFVRSESLTKSLPGRRDALTGELARLKAAHGLDKYVEGLPPDLVKRVDVITQLLGRQNNNVFGGPSLDWPKTVQEVARELQLDYLEAVRYLRLYKRGADGNCDVEAMDGVVQEIGTMVTNSSFELGLAADLPNKAQACINKGKCQPIINDARALFERYSIEEAAARINEARTQGCDVSGLDEELDYWKTLRDAVVYLNVRQQRCEFREAYEWSLKVPASIREKPLMKQTMSDVYNGLKAQERIGQLRRSAKAEFEKTNQISSAEPFIRQAEQIAAGFPCLVEEVGRFRSDYPATGRADQKPTDEVPGALGENKAKKENPTDEVPGALGENKAKKEIPTDEIPTALGGLTRPLGGSRPPFPPPGEKKPGSKTQDPTDEVPGTLGSDKGRPPVKDDSQKQPVRATPTGQRPCNANEQALWAKMTGAWEASYGTVSFSGSCENVTGHWLQGEWGERGTSLRGEIKGGRVSGSSLTFDYSQSWNNRKGSDSCYLSADKKLQCSHLETLRR